MSLIRNKCPIFKLSRPTSGHAWATREGLSLTELLVTLTLLSVLFLLSFNFVSDLWEDTRKTVAKANAATLNQALQRYKMDDGMLMAHSLEGANSRSKIDAVISSLRRGFSMMGGRKSYLMADDSFTSIGITAVGSGNTFGFVLADEVEVAAVASVASISAGPAPTATPSEPIAALVPSSSAASFTTSGSSSGLKLSGHLNFGNVELGGSVMRTLNISNITASPINVSSITLPAGYTADWTTGEIAAQDTQQVTVIFTPASAQSYKGKITVRRDGGAGASTIAVTGVGL